MGMVGEDNGEDAGAAAEPWVAHDEKSVKRPVLAQRPGNWDQMTEQEKQDWALKVAKAIRKN